MTASEPAKPSASTLHLHYQHPQDAWEQVLEPWFRAATEGILNAWLEAARSDASRPSFKYAAILAPNGASISWLKNALLQSEKVALGIEFYEPESFSKTFAKYLHSENENELETSQTKLPQAEFTQAAELALILEALGAREVLKSQQNKAFSKACVLAQAIQSDADELAKAILELENAGWGAGEFKGPAAEIAQKAQSLLTHSLGFTSKRSFYEKFANKSSGEASFLNHLLVFGFDARHWEHMGLLQAANMHSRHSTFCLPSSPINAAQMSWVNSSEAAFGPIESIQSSLHTTPSREPTQARQHKSTPTLTPNSSSTSPASAPKYPLAPLAQALENKQSLNETQSTEAAEHLEFQILENSEQEAECILQRVLALLSGGTSAKPETDATHPKSGVPLENKPHLNLRVGIIVASESLGREIATKLDAYELPYHDRPGHRVQDKPNQRLLRLWCHMQKEPQINSLIDFARALETFGMMQAADIQRLQKALQSALSQLNSEKLELIKTYAFGKPQCEPIKNFLESWPLLKEQDSFKSHFSQTETALKAMGIEQSDTLLNSKRLMNATKLELPRAAFVRWLEKKNHQGATARSKTGREIFSPLQLLSIDEATEQPWTHLIFAGMLQEQWVKLKPERFISDSLRNRLNARAEHESPHGKGEFCMPEQHSWLWRSQAHRTRQLTKLLGTVHGKAIFSAHEQDAEGRELQLMALFMQAMRLCKIEKPKTKTHRPAPARQNNFESVRKAHQARQKTDFGPYGYWTGTHQLAKPLELSCGAWESALLRPAETWYKEVLKTEPLESFEFSGLQQRVIGQWVHDSLALPKSKTPNPRPSTQLWLASMQAQAKNLQTEVNAVYKKHQMALPQAWLLRHKRACSLAAEFIRAMDAVPQKWNLLHSEYTLKTHLHEPRHPLHGWNLKGRIDLWLTQSANPKKAWIFDFKTGDTEALSLENLAFGLTSKGSLPQKSKQNAKQSGLGLQLALYALGLKSEMGLDAVSLTLLGPKNTAEAQLEYKNLFDEELKGLWERLAMIQDGCLGQWPDEQTERAAQFFQFPMAVAPISETLLKERWKTHLKT